MKITQAQKKKDKKESLIKTILSFYILAAPRYAPTEIKPIKISSTSIKFQWKSVPLSDRTLLYNILIQGDVEQTKNVNTGFGIAIMDAEIDKLLPNREYTIQIRAVNVVGSGEFSKPFKFTTKKMGKLKKEIN